VLHYRVCRRPKVMAGSDSGGSSFMAFTCISRIFAGILLLLCSSFAFPQAPASIPGLPGTLDWQNTPASWHFDDANKVLTISAGPKTDWFVDPFDGTVAKNAPILLFKPNSDYVLSARVDVSFASKWDAGALMVWGDDHHWVKLSFELLAEKTPTLVTVVTRGLSDDCSSTELKGNSVYLRIAKTDKTYVLYFSVDGKKWQILRTFSLDTDIPVRVGFEAQSPDGSGAVAKFSAITYDPHRISNIYK
jgi:regulation of enolase protein 1 (concanavalin A-like superfamily)